MVIPYDPEDRLVDALNNQPEIKNATASIVKPHWVMRTYFDGYAAKMDIARPRWEHVPVAVADLGDEELRLDLMIALEVSPCRDCSDSSGTALLWSTSTNAKCALCRLATPSSRGNRRGTRTCASATHGMFSTVSGSGVPFPSRFGDLFPSPGWQLLRRETTGQHPRAPNALLKTAVKVRQADDMNSQPKTATSWRATSHSTIQRNAGVHLGRSTICLS